jgi:hypothetical protein
MENIRLRKYGTPTGIQAMTEPAKQSFKNLVYFPTIITSQEQSSDRVLNILFQCTQNDFQLDATPETELFTADVFVYHGKRTH